MKPKDLLKLAIQLLGLIFLFQGLQLLPKSVLDLIYGLWALISRGNFYFEGALNSIIAAGWPLLLAWWLLRGAPRLMRLAYPDETPKP